MQPIVKVVTPGAPDTGWGISEIEDGHFGLKGVAGSRQNPIPVDIPPSQGGSTGVTFLIGDPLNPGLQPGDHRVIQPETRKTTPDIGTHFQNADAAESPVVVTHWDAWTLNKPMRLGVRISVQTDQDAPTFKPENSVLVDVWFVRTGAAQVDPRVQKIRFEDGDHAVTKSQFERAQSAGVIVQKGNFFFTYWLYAGTWAEFEALYPPTASQPEHPSPVPAPPPEPVPVPVPQPEPVPPPADTAWIRAAIGQVEIALDDVEALKERLEMLLLSLKGKL